MTGPFIKVTKADWPDHDYYINMALVSRLWQEDHVGAGLLVDGEAVFVTETPEELLLRFADVQAQSSPSRAPARRATSVVAKGKEITEP
jgi:hypothetical protein